MRAAFAWSRENGDAERALTLASSLPPLWQPRPAEGIAWFNAVLDDGGNRLDIAPAVRARALADRVLLVTMIGWDAESKDRADEALAIARKLDNPALLARALAACSLINLDAEAAREYRAEAIGLARSLGDTLRLSHILSVEAIVAAMKGEAARGACGRPGGMRACRGNRIPRGRYPVPLFSRASATRQRGFRWSRHTLHGGHRPGRSGSLRQLCQVRPCRPGYGTRVAGRHRCGPGGGGRCRRGHR